MSRNFQLATVIAVLPLLASAQARRMDATDPVAGKTTLPYHSALAGYQRMQETGEPSIDRWRALNEEVARIGGHAGSIKEDAQASPASQEQAESSPPVRPRHHH